MILFLAYVSASTKIVYMKRVCVCVKKVSRNHSSSKNLASETPVLGLVTGSKERFLIP
jgi:hypothetical protein